MFLSSAGTCPFKCTPICTVPRSIPIFKRHCRPDHGSHAMGHMSWGHNPWVTSHGSQVINHGSQVISYNSQVISHRLQVMGYKSWVTSGGS